VKHYTSAMFLNFALSLGFRFWQHLFFFFFFFFFFVFVFMLFAGGGGGG